jgi:hypothetical protein
MNYDKTDFAQVARVLLIVNSHAKEQFTEETLVDYMVSMAYSTIEGEGATFCGTMGFYLTGFKDHNKETQVRATLAPWLIENYIQAERKKVLDILA